MIIVVIGLGSMGKRRIRLIKEMYPQYKIYGIDNREDRRNEISTMFAVDCFESSDRIEDKVDCAFVCTSPLAHSSIITECLKKGWNVFSELNLVEDGYDNNIRLAEQNGCTLFLSSTFFYREETQYIRSRIMRNRQWNYIYHIGQYLPDWHPWENYKEIFIGNKRTNGCREIMAIELPWLIDAFGEIELANSVSDKMSGLNIDFHDNYFIQLKHKNGNKGCLIVDTVSPVAVRKFEAYTENKYLSWSGTPDSIYEFEQGNRKLVNVNLMEDIEHREGYSAFIIENAYKNEIQEFFDVVINAKVPLYGFEQDKQVLKIIDLLGA